MKCQFYITCTNFSHTVDEDLTGEADYYPEHFIRLMDLF